MRSAPFAGLVLLAAVVGCAHDDEVPISDGPAAPQPEALAPMPVVFTSTDLARVTAVGTITRTFDSAGIMHLTVPIRDASGADLAIDYRFTYMNGTRQMVDQPTGWQTKDLHAGTFEYIQGNAASPQATEFELDIRPRKYVR